MDEAELNDKFFVPKQVRAKNYELWKQGNIILIAREYAPQQVSICIRNKETPELTLEEAKAYTQKVLTVTTQRSAEVCAQKEETT